MKNKLSRRLRLTPEALVLLALCLTADAVFGAPPKAPVPAQATPGYLTKSGPSGLRIAPALKTRPLYLPPLPISPDPQPTGTSEPAATMVESAAPVVKATGQAPSAKGSVAGKPVKSNAKSAKQTSAPVSSGEAGTVTPQMLLKFFPNGKPAGVEMLLNEPMSFQVPVQATRPSSSATYEVK